MGILDDAIREHLELKRQHGAPEEEVQRQQDEALGPARRDVVSPAEDGERTVAADGEPEGTQLDEAFPELDEAAPGEAADPVEEDEREPLEAAEPESVEAAEPERSEAEHEPFEPEPLEPEPAGVEPLAPSGETPPRGFEPAPEEPVPEPLAPDAADDPFGGDEPFADEDAERHPDGDEDDEDGDVLEDTPDFLQETPEHDRLWFEQKPPRDFDFD
jgi:hypothetical protein